MLLHIEVHAEARHHFCHLLCIMLRYKRELGYDFGLDKPQGVLIRIAYSVLAGGRLPLLQCLPSWLVAMEVRLLSFTFMGSGLYSHL